MSFGRLSWLLKVFWNPPDRELEMFEARVLHRIRTTFPPSVKFGRA
jgi:hypothetical protein